MSAYMCVRHATADAFLARAETWLLSTEVEHNLILGVAAQLRNAPPSESYFATLEHDAQIVGCAFRTPPYKVGVTRMPLGAAEVLAEDVAQVYRDIPAVLGPEAVAQAVADSIARKQSGRSVVGLRQRIYELRQVVPPANPPTGKLRLAQQSDFALMVDWLAAFAEETSHGPVDARRYAQAHLSGKTAFVWDDDGPKTTALWAAATPHGVRIGFVFTPAQFRGCGYASAVTAGASQRALDSGYEFCCLYTDLGNPTSNAIYQRIGYTPVCDVVDYTIGPMPLARSG